MNQLTHWNPFKPLAKFETPAGFEDFFRNFGLRPAWRDLEVMPEIRIDVSEDDKAYRIKADIPGVKKEDIDVSIEGREIAISAESSKKTERKDESTLYTERSEGRFYRSFTLPLEVDSKSAEARYDGGVLSLTLPKKPNGKSHRITVS
jgi:HSP20 family protein